MEKELAQLHSPSNIAKVDDIELQEITENAAKSTEDLIAQFEMASLETLHMCDLLGLDKEQRRIRGSLKVEMARKIELQHDIE